MDYSAHIRTLLRCLHRPHDIERNAFALRLKNAAGAPSAYAAFAQIVEEAFAQAGDGYRLHHQVLERFDFDRRVRRKQAAADLGVSPRRFFYLHSEAIAIVERHAAALLARHESDEVTSPLLEILLDCDPARGGDALRASGASQTPESELKRLFGAILASNVESQRPAWPNGLRGPDAAVSHALRSIWLELRGLRSEAITSAGLAQQMRFDHLGNVHRLADEALHIARVAIARHDGDAASLALYAKSDRWNHLTSVEAALANGDVVHADELLQSARREATGVPCFRFTAMQCLQLAQIRLLSGNAASAAQNARAIAVIAGPHGDIAGLAAIVNARACIAMGSPLSRPACAAHGLWYALYHRALRARSMGDENAACDVFVRAACAGYGTVAAYAAATIALLQNDLHRALDAWLLWLRGRHFEQGFDMMPERLGRALLATEPARRVVHELAEAECSQWPVHCFLQTPVSRDLFWSGVLDAALGGKADAMPAGFMSALLKKPVAVERAENGNAPSPRRLAKLIAIVLPCEERASFVERFTQVANYCNARARRRRDQLRGRHLLELSG